MREITPAIIQDLLPVYLAGDASEDTRRVIEEGLESDPALRELLNALSQPAADAAPADELAVAEWQSVQRTRDLLRRRNLRLALAAALTVLLGAAIVVDGGLLSPLRDYLPPAILLYSLTLASWASFLATCRSLAPTGLEPPIGPRGYRVRLYWGIVGYSLGFLGGVILDALTGWGDAPIWIGVGGGLAAWALGERWRQIPRPDEIELPISLFDKS